VGRPPTGPTWRSRSPVQKRRNTSLSRRNRDLDRWKPSSGKDRRFTHKTCSATAHPDGQIAIMHPRAGNGVRGGRSPGPSRAVHCERRAGNGGRGGRSPGPSRAVHCEHRAGSGGRGGRSPGPSRGVYCEHRAGPEPPPTPADTEPAATFGRSLSHHLLEATTSGKSWPYDRRDATTSGSCCDLRVAGQPRPCGLLRP
jgi:hypothetical protein